MSIPPARTRPSVTPASLAYWVYAIPPWPALEHVLDADLDAGARLVCCATVIFRVVGEFKRARRTAFLTGWIGVSYP